MDWFLYYNDFRDERLTLSENSNEDDHNGLDSDSGVSWTQKVIVSNWDGETNSSLNSSILQNTLISRIV